jgi:hypothetical protein
MYNRQSKKVIEVVFYFFGAVLFYLPRLKAKFRLFEYNNNSCVYAPAFMQSK